MSLYLNIQKAFLLITLIGSNLHALNNPPTVVEVAVNPNHLGHKYCTTADTVKVENLPVQAGDDDFQFIIVRADEKNPKANVCQEKPNKSDFEPENKFPKSKPLIKGKQLLSENACIEGDRQTKVLCIYRDHRMLVAKASFSYDTRKPAIKGIPPSTIKAVNGEISFIIDDNGVGGEFEICYGKSPGDIDKLSGTDPCPSPPLGQIFQSNPKFTIDVEPDTLYTFKVRLKGNPPQKWDHSFKRAASTVYFPLDDYDGKGGEGQFSCQTTGQSAWVLLLALLFLIVWRKRSALVGMFMGVFFMTALISIPKDAHADLGQMSFGLLGAMYRPDLDQEKGLSFPFYRAHFRKNKSDVEGPILPLIGAEVDWHLWDGFGSVQLGFGVSYTYASGHGLKKKNGKPDPDEWDGKASLHMYQLRPQLTYIFNPFVEQFPLAPYVRAALIGQGYNFTHDGKDAGTPSVKPNGFRFGYQFGVGLMFMLDFLEPSAVTGARSAGLFEHVYLKGELSYTKIDSFGAPGFQFSPKDVMGTGLPLMWTFGLVFELPN